jgi:hypothetical protein
MSPAMAASMALAVTDRASSPSRNTIRDLLMDAKSYRPNRRPARNPNTGP